MTHQNPSSIIVFLSEGDPNGTRTAEISMSTIQAIAFRRSRFREVRGEFTEMEKPGVYILIGLDDGDGDQWHAYIGESENVGNRLTHHITSPKEIESEQLWDVAIVLICKDEYLTKSHARYAESRLIEESKKNPRWIIRNKANPSDDAGRLPRHDRASMNKFIDEAKTLVGVLGWDIFREMRGRRVDQERNEKSSDVKLNNDEIFEYEGKGFSAKMIISESGEFEIKHGSRARIHEAEAIPNLAKKNRDLLKKKEILIEDGEFLIFSSDYKFSSVSAAAAVVSGSSVSGRSVWKLPDNRTYAEWEESEVARDPVNSEMQ